MESTAQFIESNLKAEELKVPIIFTGAMRPLGFIDTDALQNVSEAIMACGIAIPGVYVSFHGLLIPAFKAQKNYEKRTFDIL